MVKCKVSYIRNATHVLRIKSCETVTMNGSIVSSKYWIFLQASGLPLVELKIELVSSVRLTSHELQVCKTLKLTLWNHVQNA